MKSTVSMVVNATTQEFLISDGVLLIDFLREQMGLTGTKQGCDGGECGACAVLIDGQLRLSCVTLAKTVAGQSIETIESLAHKGRISRLQAMFHEKLGTQCGFCTPGMIMAAEALLRVNPNPDRDQIKLALSGNLCRCTGYVKIIESVEAAIENSGAAQ